MKRRVVVLWLVVALGGLGGLGGLAALGGCRRQPDPLPLAAERGPVAIEAALARGARVDERGEGGRTALHVAAARADAEVVALLVLRGADVDLVDAGGATALHLAAQRGATGCVGVLARVSRAVDAAAGRNGRTALHDAVLFADADAARALLAAGADVRAKDAAGKTALHLVARADPFRVASIAPLLLDAGADPAAADARGFTPVHAAAHADDAVLLRLVAARAAAALDVVTPLGESPLDVALRYRRDLAAEALVAAGARTSLLGDALPPLHEAARTDDVARAAKLLGAGADASRVALGKTALEVAREHGSRRVEVLLARP